VAPLTDIDIIYAAHTASCTFLLDSEGICRRIVMAPNGKRRDSSRTASRCVGAQYVASLDGSAAGGLVEMPRVGAAMLFARVDERGRVSLVRTSVVTSFEAKATEDPFLDSGTVETSAPALTTPRAAATERSEYRRPPRTATDEQPAADFYDDPSDRTQRIQALREEDVEAALDEMGGEQNTDFTTAEYDVVSEQPAPRITLPSPQVSTLRNPRQSAINDDEDDEDEYARATLVAAPASPVPAPAPSRGMLPSRRSDPHMRAAASQGWTPPHDRQAPRAYDSDVQVRRRRGG